MNRFFFSTDLSILDALRSSDEEMDLLEQRLADCGNDLSEPFDAAKWL